MSFLVNFFRRKISSNVPPFDFLELDIQNHILPDLDDGPKDANVSISMLVELKKLGFKSVISSPYTITHQFPNTPKSILRRYISFISSIDTSNRLLPKFHSPLSLYTLDSEFTHIRKSGDMLAANEGYILVNYSDTAALSHMEAEIIELTYSRYKPILIQPERYISLHGNAPYFEALVNRGCLLGLNLLSLQGVYGKAVQKMAFKLIENHLYSFACTGIMKSNHIKDLKSLANNSRLMNKIIEYPFLNSTLSKQYDSIL